MLDDANVLKQRDPGNALQVAADEWKQVQFAVEIADAQHDERQITKVVVAGMGGSALAAELVKTWLADRLQVTFEIIREYKLPAYVDGSTLVIASSYSGNTEETLGCFEQARERGAQVGIIAAGGKLVEIAKADASARVVVPDGLEPRMGVLFNFKALVSLLVNFGVVSAELIDEIEQTTEWLQRQTLAWLSDVPTDKNQAKQLALLAVGKTGVFYGGQLTGAVAHKWKVGWNENAKNVSMWNVYPEASHNEFVGWSSHPVDKPFAVFDIKSSFEHPRILKRLELTDRLLSGLRPKAKPVELEGDTILKQLLWGSILGDFVSIYLAILNGVDPTPVALVDKFKNELG